MGSTHFSRAVFIGYLSQASTLVFGLLSIPLLLSHFSPEQFGLWALSMTIVGYFTLSNLGIPTACSVILASIEADEGRYKVLVKSVLLLTGAVATVFVMCVFFAYHFPEWTRVLGALDGVEPKIARTVVYILVCASLVKIFLSIAVAAFLGFQRVDIVKSYDLLLVFVSFIAVYLAVFVEGDLITLAWFTAIGWVTTSACTFFHFVYFYRKLLLQRNQIDIVGYRILFLRSVSFFLIGIASTLVWGTDNLIIGNMLGVGQVSIYSISFRLFAIFYACVTLINGVLIPMYGKLSSVSDWGEIRRILKLQITLMPIIAGLVWIDGILLAKEAISLWLNRNDMFGGYLLVFSLGGYGYILSYVSVFSSTLTALNQASTLARLAWLEAILNLAFSLFLVTYFGVGGVAMGTMLAALFCPMVMLRSRINSYNGGVLRLSYKDSSKHFILILLPSVVIALIISDYSKMLVVKMALAILLNGGYIYLSWKIIPAEVKSFISSQSGFLAK